MGIEVILWFELKSIIKCFFGVLVNDQVSFFVQFGEIYVLFGENGVGKLIFVKMIYGIMQLDGGEICWNGEWIVVVNFKVVCKFGIGMVFQYFLFFEVMMVLENIVFGMDVKIFVCEFEVCIKEVMM